MKKIRNPYAGMEDQGYNCFACCPSNPFGLKMEFYEDGDDIVCIWEPDLNYQSWIGTLHGGIQATLLDETGALQSLLAGISDAGASIVTINQATPENGAAQVAVAIRTGTMQMSVEEMMNRLVRQRTVVEVHRGL